MKTRFITGLLVVGAAFQILAQRVENDDMYFRKKDREKLRSAGSTEEVYLNDDFSAPRKKNKIKETEPTTSVNPTDSYSAENINPEYVSRANSEKATEEEFYFEESYSPNSYNSYSSYGNQWNSSIGFNNAWLANPYTWNDPFFYSPYAFNPWMSNPYTGGFGYGSGWSLSMSYFWGNSWGSGWNYGLTFGWGNPYFNYYSPFYSPYFFNSWGNPYYGGFYYGDVNSNINFGRRPSRNSALVIPTKRISITNTGGRVRTTTSSDDEYYVKPSRRSTNFNPTNTQSQNRPENSAPRIRNSNQNNNSSPSFSFPSRSNSSGSSPSRPASAPARSSGRSRGN